MSVGGGAYGATISGAKTSKGFLAIGNTGIVAGSTTNIPISGGAGTGTDEDESQLSMPIDGILRSLSIRSDGNSSSVIIPVVIRKNALDTVLIVSIPAGFNGVTEIETDVPFVKGDLVSIRVVAPAGAGGFQLKGWTQLDFQEPAGIDGNLGKGGAVTFGGGKASNGSNGFYISAQGLIAPISQIEFIGLGAQASDPNETRTQHPMPRSGKVKLLEVKPVNNTISGNPSLTFQVRKNGLNIGGTLVFVNNDNTVKRIVLDETFAKEDLINIRVLSGTGAGSANFVALIQLEFDDV